jgi:hypothetical protein
MQLGPEPSTTNPPWPTVILISSSRSVSPVRNCGNELVIQNLRQIVLIGDPGVGKSCVHHLHTRKTSGHADEETNLPTGIVRDRGDRRFRTFHATSDHLPSLIEVRSWRIRYQLQGDHRCRICDQDSLPEWDGHQSADLGHRRVVRIISCSCGPDPQ